MRFGLRGKLAVILAAIIVIAFTLVYFATSRLATSILMDQEIRSLSGQSEVLVSILVRLAHSQQELDQALEKTSSQADFETVQVLDREFRTVAPRRCTPAEVHLGGELLRKLAARSGPKGIVRSHSMGNVFVNVVALPGGGYLFAARSAKPFLERKRSIVMLLVIWGAVVMLAILLGGSLLLRNVVTRPIERLVREAGAIAEGSKNLMASELDTDEFGALRTSLASMARRLQADRLKIEDQVQELQEVNRRLEDAREQLVRTEKLASVGQLAAGVAHEIGNPIGVILGYVEMLEDGTVSGEESIDSIRQIKQATERIQVTIRDLLDFSRPAKDEEDTSDVVIETQNVIKFVQPQKRFRNVHIVLDSARADGLQCAMPPSRYKQVLLNLLFNAADAMDGKGTITLTLAPPGKKAGKRMVTVAVADSGPGIPDAVMLRIFDPFFTTKGVGMGTGLGLYVCHTLMNRYDGTIEVGTRLEGGAVFSLAVPLAG